ncbi:hypothetical protein H558_13090 [Bordetella holmesii H558]|nr:hypothetical protein H558_13090 [Bordetella holmesii H558]AOB35249.1 hypothetical protein BBB42_06860 [Bordetella holmesii]
MLLFAFTGLTLNNASHIESKARVETRHTRLPYAELAAVKEAATRRAARLPQSAGAWLEREFGIDALRVKPEWSSEEAYLSLPRAGGDAWLSIDIQSGEVEYERTDRGWISYLNDLHKGRHTGLAWSWFLDLFALACLVFSLTGLVLLKMHAGHRAATWPMVGLGVVIPVVLALLFIH